MQLADPKLESDLTEVEHPLVDIVIPVSNAEHDVARSVRQLRSYLDASFPFSALITIVDNGSTDDTALVATRLAAELRGVRVLHLDAKGRGRALRAAWSDTEAPVVAYMDVDLSTSLDALLPLVAPLLSGHSDVAIGSRLARGARVVRSPKRELISRLYNVLLHSCLRNDFSDAQCGFKAARTSVAQRLLPQVKDNAWFFDTEFLIRAERSGLRIHEVPVDWVDDLDSRVDIVPTAVEDLRGLIRIALGKQSRRPVEDSFPRPDRETTTALVRFARIGVSSTIAYLLLFFALRGALGPFGANATGLAICTLANLVAHRRLAPIGSLSRRHVLLGGSTAFGTSLICTTIGLACTEWLHRGSPLDVVIALVLANAAAAPVRFAVLHAWMFRGARSSRSLNLVSKELSS
jgi:glycosyltransferase involved in cell wall biosynthesis